MDILDTQPNSPPKNKDILLHSARQLAGLNLEQLAHLTGRALPTSTTHAKGWLGQTVEHYLGATARSRPEPDFPHLGIEMKTLPLNNQGTPRESTYICHISLMDLHQQQWHTSWIYQKLQHVLWIPYQADPAIPYARRCLGTPLLWQLSTTQARLLQQDWEELMEKLSLGEQNQISAHLGQYLQIRPKAANARSLTPAYNEQGEHCQTLPLGFYLRTEFTRKILAQCFISQTPVGIKRLS